jgi:phosphate:Na+ symporter
MNELDLFPLIMGLFGGLAIFLFGMEQMTDALKSVAGSGMSKVLARLTKNRFTAAITGAFVTAVIQSSSVTTVLVVGFISAGLMSLQQSVGVIMGANVGTTITAQIIAFKVTQYALALVTVGFAAMFMAQRKKWQLYGAMVMGLGMIFLGMGFMSDATEPLRTYEPFINLMQQMDRPLLGILIAAVFTALVQSSSATTGIVIVLASQGFITLEAGITLAFGANIGTCVTAVLAALGKPREATQAAAVHLLFNVLGVLIWLPFIGQLAGAVQSISPAYPELEGVARLAAETPRQIANAHTAFNALNTLIFLGFTGPLAALVTRLLPKRPEVLPELARPQYLQEVYLQTPALALDSVRQETIRLGRQVAEIGVEAGTAARSGSEEDLDSIVERSGDNQRLFDAINEYIRRLSAEELTGAESRRLATLTSVAGHVQNTGESNAVNVVAIGRERLARNVSFSADTVERGQVLTGKVREAFDLAIRSLEEPELAREVIAMKPEMQELAAEMVEHLARRLGADAPDRALLYRLESQALELIQRQFYFAKKIAKDVVREFEASIEDSVLAEELASA